MVLIGTLTCAPLTAFPQVQNHAQAVTGLKQPESAARAEALAWLARYGGMADQPLLLGGLRDEDPRVREIAEQALWLLWTRSGDDAVDRLLQDGILQMQAGRLAEAIATFSEVIRRRPAFAEGWNKRATARFMAGDLQRSLADCDEVMKRNRHHFGALSGYGQIYFRLEEYEKAIAWWRRALEVNPNMDGVEANIEEARKRLDAKRARTT
jgi:tetratricopeptide (TPR) repeat protein